MVYRRPPASARPRRRPARSLAGLLITALAAFVCLFFVHTLRDSVLAYAPAAVLPAPPIPDDLAVRDADLAVSVVDESGAPVPGASVRVFALRSGKAFFAGDGEAGADGVAHFVSLPRGESWVLAYAPGRMRASMRAILEPGARGERMTLRPAKALDVIVVDEAEHPLENAELELTTADPLPYAAVTAADGTARLDRLGPAPYRIRASALGFDDVVRTGIMPGPAPLRIRMEHLSTMVVTVVGPDGQPVADATVFAAGTGLWPARSTYTDDAGVARIAGLHGGVYDLKASRGDLVSPTDFAIPLKRGETKATQLVLAEGKRVRVTVVDGEEDDARPIKFANVVLAEEGLSSFPMNGRTNEAGVVELGPIARVSSAVSARAQGFVARTAVRVPALATEAHVALRRGGALVGDVVDDRGYPIEGATIEVVGVDKEGLPIDEATAMSDFREEHFEMMLGGPAPLIPMGELGVMPGPVPDLPPESAVASLNSVGGSGALVASGANNHAGGDPWSTKRDGTFRADPIPPGRVHAIVRHPAYVEAMSDLVSIESGGEGHVHVVLRQGGSIEGRVLEDDRSPVAGARVDLAAAHGTLERTTFTADDGTFTFTSVPDQVTLSVARPGAPDEPVARATIDVPDRERQEVEIILPKARDAVSFRVVDEHGYALSRVEIRVVSLQLDELRRRTLFTDNQGEAELRDAVGLPVRLTVVRPGKAPLVRAVDSAPKEIEITLQDGVKAYGKVTARGDRDLVVGAEVTVFTSAGARHATTNDDGEFHLDDLAPGRVRIAVRDADHAPQEVESTVKAQAHDRESFLGTIQLADAGDVEGEVVDANDDPVAGARVAVDGVPTYLPLGPLPPGITITNRKGHFELHNVPSGKVILEAYSAELGRGQIDDIPVRVGRTTHRVKIVIDGETPASKEAKGSGSLAITLGQRGRTVVVVMVPYGSEAEAAGMEPGDEVLAIDGRNVHFIERARDLLTGPLGQDVLVELKREDGNGSDEFTLRVRRERVRR